MVQKNFGRPVGIADLVAARMRKRSPARPLPNPGGPGSLQAGPRPVFGPQNSNQLRTGLPRKNKAALLGMMAGLQRRF